MCALRLQSTVSTGQPGPGLLDSPSLSLTTTLWKGWMVPSLMFQWTSYSVQSTLHKAREPQETKAASAWATRSSCSSTTMIKTKSASSQKIRVEQLSEPATHASSSLSTQRTRQCNPKAPRPEASVRNKFKQWLRIFASRATEESW